MQAKWRLAGLAVFIGGALWANAGSADARPGYIVSPGSHTIEFGLWGSHGYVLNVTEVNRRRVELYASHGDAAAVYLIPARHTRADGIEAEFPGMGRISVVFHPNGPTEREPGFFPPCKGGETVIRPGYFEGTIRFRGERGYTTVRATRAKGQVVSTAKEICKRLLFDDDPGANKPIEQTRLIAFSKSAGSLVRFYASRTEYAFQPQLHSTFFFGSSSERRRGMRIGRVAVSLAKSPATFAIGNPGAFPASATAVPPDPFHGTAAFQRNPGTDNEWTGSLSVDLPGLGRVPMAGPDFSASLCHNAGCRNARRRPAMSFAQGSGSQSQAFWDARLSWSR